MHQGFCLWEGNGDLEQGRGKIFTFEPLGGQISGETNRNVSGTSDNLVGTTENPSGNPTLMLRSAYRRR